MCSNSCSSEDVTPRDGAASEVTERARITSATHDEYAFRKPPVGSSSLPVGSVVGKRCQVGRKKRVGFADLQATHAELGRGELRCPECSRGVSDADALKYVPAFGQAESSLATLNCPRCRTTISIRFVAAH